MVNIWILINYVSLISTFEKKEELLFLGCLQQWQSTYMYIIKRNCIIIDLIFVFKTDCQWPYLISLITWYAIVMIDLKWVLGGKCTLFFIHLPVSYIIYKSIPSL